MSTHTSTVNFVNIPAELKSSCRFCTWKMERGAKSSRLTKVPYKPGNQPESTDEQPGHVFGFHRRHEGLRHGRL